MGRCEDEDFRVLRETGGFDSAALIWHVLILSRDKKRRTRTKKEYIHYIVAVNNWLGRWRQGAKGHTECGYYRKELRFPVGKKEVARGYEILGI